MAAVGGSPGGLSVFLCGHADMVRSLQTGLQRAGVPARPIHREHFDLR
jgi:predicted ferric reductase